MTHEIKGPRDMDKEELVREVERLTVRLHEKKRLTADLIIRADRKTGSTHMTDRKQWGELMAAYLNAIPAPPETPKPAGEPRDGLAREMFECKYNDCSDLQKVVINNNFVPPAASHPTPQGEPRLRDALQHIVEVASGERQVADDDTGGMEYIDQYARKAILEAATPPAPAVGELCECGQPRNSIRHSAAAAGSVDAHQFRPK